MQSPLLRTIDLHSVLRAVVRGDQSARQVTDLIAVCHALATAVLRARIAAAMLQSRLHFSSYADMAYDCIADLFSRSPAGVLTQMKGYFESVDLAELEREELLGHLRRLVTSKVNHSIFRIYGEIDPVTGKIMRNVKLAIQAASSFTLSTRLGEMQLSPAMIEPALHLPALTAEEIERALSFQSAGSDTVPEILSRLSLFLRKQTTHARVVSFLTVVRAIRSLYAQGGEIEERGEIEDGFTASDTTALIREACVHLKQEMAPKYVGKKVAPAIYEAYFTVIEQSLVDHFCGDDGGSPTLFEKLTLLRPEIDRKAYFNDHRAVLEYLGRLSREKVAKHIEKNL
jgi:hypothetical protein